MNLVVVFVYKDTSLFMILGTIMEDRQLIGVAAPALEQLQVCHYWHLQMYQTFLYKVGHILFMFLSLSFQADRTGRRSTSSKGQERLNLSWSNCDIKMPVKIGQKSGHQVIFFQEKTSKLNFQEWWKPWRKIEIKCQGKKDDFLHPCCVEQKGMLKLLVGFTLLGSFCNQVGFVGKSQQIQFAFESLNSM